VRKSSLVAESLERFKVWVTSLDKLLFNQICHLFPSSEYFFHVLAKYPRRKHTSTNIG
jgi:hypothetical protein